MERYYANVVHGQGGPYDLTLDFGQKVGAEGEAEYEVRVAMSWEHAVSLALVLRTLIDNYQSQVGQLPNIETVLPEGLSPPADKERGGDDDDSRDDSGPTPATGEG